MPIRSPAAALGALAILAGLTGPAPAQGTRSPPAAAKTAPPPERTGDDAVAGVDPAVMAQCKAEADNKKLKGAPRAEFMRACVEPED
ncbi:hypothetical protein OPKNFCMD_1177 [Methylobacterium crusticola]|uniref:PsiF repeat-containing protein n=1 Tax=Methylobacterium crusticola TaxID=1697972 RepID=A0ABQ4QT11_9HYPH|nr:PsiF family protein [Methylobacterium crusticola]GJD48458.1 hypothetical protein OPKNFCMD_1177 [Methylobacterium crusticola]